MSTLSSRKSLTSTKSGMTELTSILATLKTKDDANKFIAKLEDIAAKVNTENFSLAKEIEVRFGSKIGRLLKKVVSAERGSSVKMLIQRVRNLPVIEIRTPVNLSEKSENRITNWLIRNVTQSVLVDYVVRKPLVAGVEIYYDGNFVDISLRKQIERKLDEIV